MREELRCYTWTDFMLSSIQQGIQSGHASMELVSKYMLVTGWQNGMAEYVGEWAQEHKTIICYNGGAYADVCETLRFFDVDENPYPFAGFTEEDVQGGNLTSVAVILPARIFNTAPMLRRAKYVDDISVTWDHLLEELRVGWVDEDGKQQTATFNAWERELMRKLNESRFAS